MSGAIPLTRGIKPRILERLKQADGDFVLTRDLIDHVWSVEPSEPEHAVNWNIRQLRKLGFPILSKRGAGSPGYRLIPRHDSGDTGRRAGGMGRS